MITFNENITAEVAETAIAAATVEGVFLSYNSDGVLALPTAGTVPDAIMVSEIVTASEFKDRQYIYTEIDYSYFTQIGEPISVVKRWNKLTANGLAVTATAKINKGTELEVAATGKLVPKDSGTAIARALDEIAAGAVRTGNVHLY